MAKKYYVVWKGSQTGVFDNWSTVQQATAGRSDAQFMGFPSKQEAELAYTDTYTKALMNRSLAKGSNTAVPSTTLTINRKNVANSADINIYCDGACSPNPGKSGTGIAVYNQTTLTQLWYGLYEANGTNNTAELNGLLEAFKLAAHYIELGKNVQILSDSKYSIDCITKWAPGWQKRGWKKADGQPIKNPELVQACFTYYQKIKTNISITHVKGHANIEGNELSDRMAVLARMTEEKSFKQYQKSIDIKTILAMPSG